MSPIDAQVFRRGAVRGVKPPELYGHPSMLPLRCGRVCLCLSSLMANSLATECGARTYFFCWQDSQQHCLQFTRNASARDTCFDPKVHTCRFVLFFSLLCIRGCRWGLVDSVLMLLPRSCSYTKKKPCVHANAIFGASFSSDSALCVPHVLHPDIYRCRSSDWEVHRQTRRRLRISFFLESLWAAACTFGSRVTHFCR